MLRRNGPIAWCALALFHAAFASAQLPTPPYSNPPPYPARPDPGPLPAVAPWPANGVPVCDTPGQQRDVTGTDDFAHGAYLAWEDGRGGNYDIYAIRLGPDGLAVPGWNPSGFLVAGGSGDQDLTYCISDGTWGAYVTWNAYVDGVHSLFVQKLTAAGTIASGWPDGGRRVCAADSHAYTYVFPDQQGGLQFLSVQARGKATAYHMSPDGTPYGSWPACGIVAVQPLYWEDWCCGVTASRRTADALGIWPDGIFAEYVDDHYRTECHFYEGQPYCVIHAFNGCEGFVQFQGAGTSQQALHFYPGGQYCEDRPSFRPDDAGGFLVNWPPNLSRVGVNGNPTWTVVAPGELISAGEGSYFLRSDRNFVRLAGDGTVMPGWSMTAPQPMCEPPCQPGYALDPVPDGVGGAFLGWQDSRDRGYAAYVGHLLHDGTRDPQFPPSGLPVAIGVGEFGIGTMIGDRRGSVIVVWSDSRTGQFRLYARRFTTDFVVETAASLVSSTAAAERVEIVWAMSSHSGVLSVERRVAEEDWRWIASPLPDGTRRVRFIDEEVVEGAIYSYRLLEAGRVLSEVAVEVPSTFTLGFEGAKPNPTARGVDVVFTLQARGDVELRMTDVAGRTVRERRVDGVTAGRHVVALTSAGELVPGTYFIEFRAGASRSVRRAVVVR